MTCEETRISLGVYLVGAIDPAERAEVDQHLRDCAACRAELSDLAMLPEMLEKVGLDDLGVAPSPIAGDELFARIAARVEADGANPEGSTADFAEVVEPPRWRRWRVIAAAAAVVIVVGGASATAVSVLHSTTDGPTWHKATAGSISMSIAVSSQATGSALRVAVSGLPEDEDCWLYAIADDGTKELVSRWEATYAGEAQVTGSTTIPSAELNRLVLVGNGGQQLVTVPV